MKANMKRFVVAVSAAGCALVAAADNTRWKGAAVGGAGRSVMSDAYWAIWNDAEQARIDADIERNRKADGAFFVGAPDGTDVKVEQIAHEFRFGAHVFNFNQLGKTDYNDAYKASYGEGGLFNQATVAFYWKDYEPVPGRTRAYGDYEDTERFWNSLSRAEATAHPFWRRPAPMPVIDFLKSKGVAIHGHILVWGLAKPDWIYDAYCPENEKLTFDDLGIPRRAAKSASAAATGAGDYNRLWRAAWAEAYSAFDERELAERTPTFADAMRRIFRQRVFDVAGAFGNLVDSWDVVNESSVDWAKYRRSRTGLGYCFSIYGLMPGDYPLHALLDAKASMPSGARLAINDYAIDENFLAQVRDLEREGARIDLVGCQMHIFNTNDSTRLAQGATDVKWVGSPKIIRDRLDLMAKTGKALHVSEVTIAAPGEDARSREIQAILTRNIYRAWFSHPKTMGITWWNTVDGGGVAGEPLVSGLFTADMKRKPAYDALDQLINHEWKTKTTVAATGGKVSFRGFRGTYLLSWTCPTCGLRHSRRVVLAGDGTVEPDGGWTNRQCRRMARSFLVDGKRVDLAPGETKLDLGKIYPGDVRQGSDGDRWATLEFGLETECAGASALEIHNDFFGELSVNGGPSVALKGPYVGYTPVNVQLQAGLNKIVFRTRSGSGGKWTTGFRLPGSGVARAAKFVCTQKRER